MDTPDENAYVADDYRIVYLAAHVRAMGDAIYEDVVGVLGTQLGIVLTSFLLERVK